MATGPDAQNKFDMSQSEQTWHSFLRLAGWIIAGSAIILIGMAMFLTSGSPTP